MSYIRLACEAMRSRFEILLSDPHRTDADLRAAGEEALAEIARWESLLSAHRPGADMQRLNAQGANGPQKIDARLMTFLLRASELSAATNHAFDPTIAPLLHLWGIGSDPQAATPPIPKAITEALNHIGISHLLLDSEQGTAAFDTPGVQLAPGALGKGWALDHALALLREAGITNALLHGGTSSITALGLDPATNAPWLIALSHPIEGQPPICRLPFTDRSLSVSLATNRDGVPHVVDPRTGQLVTGNLLAAAIAPSATDAEALSTALLVLGKPHMQKLADRFPKSELLLVSKSGGENSLCVFEDSLRVFSVGESWQAIPPSR